MTKRQRVGKREREARKRHRRARVIGTGTKWEWLKLGRKKMRTYNCNVFSASLVADTERRQGKHPKEFPTQDLPPTI